MPGSGQYGRAIMTETKPTDEGDKLGQLSPEKEWVWMGPGSGWKQTRQPANRAIRKLEE